ncbi:MAG TPA: hypothetical protein VEK08_14480 [Planctomycetota bacterium]|nr:hypothetical protein [Planctomycetota bacterium]
MRLDLRWIPLFFCFFSLLHGADAPDGTTFQHSVLSVDGHDSVRIRFCGVPLQLKLANLQFKGAESEKASLKYLKETLKPGTSVKFELEPDSNTDSPVPPQAQLFAGTMHVNLEMVKKGVAVSDGRSKKFGSAMQTAQLDAMTRKAGIWASSDVAVAPTPKPPPPANVTTPKDTPPVTFLPPTPSEASAQAAATQDVAPDNYSGAVVADLSSKEYHYPASRYAKSIRTAAKIEYRNPEEAERAGKIPSPFSFPARAKALSEKSSAASGGGSQKVIEAARKAHEEALTYMSEARKLSKTNNAAANENWKKAAKLLSEHLDRVIPISDSDPNNRDLQKLSEDMSMNLYSCKKYQSL